MKHFFRERCIVGKVNFWVNRRKYRLRSAKSAKVWPVRIVYIQTNGRPPNFARLYINNHLSD